MPRVMKIDSLNDQQIAELYQTLCEHDDRFKSVESKSNVYAVASSDLSCVPYYNQSLYNVNVGTWSTDVTTGKHLLSVNSEIATIDVPLWGSIVVEAIFLIVGLCGIRLPANQNAYARAFAVIANNCRLQDLALALSRAEGMYAIAVATWHIFVEAGGKTVLKMIQACTDEVAWWEWALMATGLLAQVTALVATDGAVVIAEIVVVLANAGPFIAKLTKL